MANGKVHAAVGITVGSIAALHGARDQTPMDQFFEGVGGGVAGYFGGKLPDVIEPAIHSWHRGFAHSATVGATVVASMPKLDAWARYSRERSAHYRSLRSNPQADALTGLVYLLLDFLWRLAAGFMSGLAAGYVSHLALDAFTPRGIPVI